MTMPPAPESPAARLGRLHALPRARGNDEFLPPSSRNVSLTRIAGSTIEA
jgi:hypothetical protein